MGDSDTPAELADGFVGTAQADGTGGVLEDEDAGIVGFGLDGDQEEAPFGACVVEGLAGEDLVIAKTDDSKRFAVL